MISPSSDSEVISKHPGRSFLETARETNRGDEFEALMDWVRNGLDEAISQRLTSDVVAVEPIAPIAGHVFRSLYVDYDLDYHAWTAEMMSLRDELDQASVM